MLIEVIDSMKYVYQNVAIATYLISACVFISFYVCANVCQYVCVANSCIVNVSKSYMRKEPQGFCYFLMVMHQC